MRSTLNCALLVESVEDLEDPESGAVIDCGVVVVILSHAFDGLNELDIVLN
jgi:hypothetical protein